MGCHHGHLLCPERPSCSELSVTVVTMKTIIIAGYLPYRITNKINFQCFVIYKRIVKKRCTTHVVAHCGCNFFMSRDIRGGHGTNFLIAVTYESQYHPTLCLQKNDYVQTPPVELAQYKCAANNHPDGTSFPSQINNNYDELVEDWIFKNYSSWLSIVTGLKINV